MGQEGGLRLDAGASYSLPPASVSATGQGPITEADVTSEVEAWVAERLGDAFGRLSVAFAYVYTIPGVPLVFAAVVLKVRMIPARAQNPAPAAGQGVLLAMTDLADGKRLIPGLFEEMWERSDFPLRCELDVLLKGQIALLCLMRTM